MDSSTDNSRMTRDTARHRSRVVAETSTLCARGCGFYGTSENGGLCSKCYAADLNEKNAKLLIDKLSKMNISTEQSTDEVVDAVSDGSKASASVKSRCGMCGKKVGLLGFKCRCGGNFCGMHRHKEVHLCGTDYKKAGRFAIEEENPLVRADKIRDRI